MIDRRCIDCNKVVPPRFFYCRPCKKARDYLRHRRWVKANENWRSMYTRVYGKIPQHLASHRKATAKYDAKNRYKKKLKDHKRWLRKTRFD